MTTDTNTVIPDNKEIVQRSTSTDVVQLRVETATNVKNGRLVIRGTTDGDCIVATNEIASAIGWVIRDETDPVVRETDRTTDYTAGNIVAVCSGPGTKLVVSASAAAEYKNKMVSAGAGQVKPFSADAADTIVAVADHSISATGFLVVTSLI